MCNVFWAHDKLENRWFSIFLYDRNAKQEINKVPSAHQTRARIAMFNAHLVLQPISFFFVAIVQHCFKVRKGLIFYQEVCDEMKLN